MQAQERRGLQNDCGADQPARAHEERTQTVDKAIRKTEIGRPFAGTIEDEQLLLDEHGFSQH